MPALKDIEQPVAIAMWYVSWLWRRYPGGGFEDWDRALDELEERGYNAVRIDAFPHLVARDRDGRSVDVFHVPAYLSEFARTESALGRLPTADEVARACLMLASSDASAISGQCLNIDCGVLPQ